MSNPRSSQCPGDSGEEKLPLNGRNLQQIQDSKWTVICFDQFRGRGETKMDVNIEERTSVAGECRPPGRQGGETSGSAITRTNSGGQQHPEVARRRAQKKKKTKRTEALPLSGAHLCLYADGTKVTEEFFQTLPDNTELVLLSRDQTWSGGVVYDIGQLLNTGLHSDGLIQAAKRLLSDERSPKRRKILTDLLLNLEDRSELESRKEDEDWFKGIDARFKTKSSYMKFNCEGRIRGYMKEVLDTSKAVENDKVRAECVKTSECLVEMLKSVRYNGRYFDRMENAPDCFCTKEGWFTCQGSFDQDHCLSLHSINPYSSKESRIVFSTWNLDHRIEKKRTIIPTLMEALQNHKSKVINLDYFYRLLFTKENLKLVHIVCHKKGAHNLMCDEDQVFIPTSSTDKGRRTKRKKRRLQ